MIETNNFHIKEAILGDPAPPARMSSSLVDLASWAPAVGASTSSNSDITLLLLHCTCGKCFELHLNNQLVNNKSEGSRRLTKQWPVTRIIFWLKVPLRLG